MLITTEGEGKEGSYVVLEHSDGKAGIMWRRVEGPPPDMLTSSCRY